MTPPSDNTIDSAYLISQNSAQEGDFSFGLNLDEYAGLGHYLKPNNHRWSCVTNVNNLSVKEFYLSDTLDVNGISLETEGEVAD